MPESAQKWETMSKLHVTNGPDLPIEILLTSSNPEWSWLHFT